MTWRRGDITLHGPGPYKARSASDKTDDWPFWFVCQHDEARIAGLFNILRIGLAMFTSKERAQEIAATANKEICL